MTRLGKHGVSHGFWVAPTSASRKALEPAPKVLLEQYPAADLGSALVGDNRVDIRGEARETTDLRTRESSAFASPFESAVPRCHREESATKRPPRSKYTRETAVRPPDTKCVEDRKMGTVHALGDSLGTVPILLSFLRRSPRGSGLRHQGAGVEPEKGLPILEARAPFLRLHFSAEIASQARNDMMLSTWKCRRRQRLRPAPTAPSFSRTQGFSLVELIVAMAIFLVLMGGLTALYTNAVQTVVFGYQQQEGFEKARASLKVLERDLNMAFTSRDYGGSYDFFGDRDGFAFVGLLSDGQLGRVSYVFHPTADRKSFTTEFAALYRDLHQLARDQGFPVAALQAAIADQFPAGVTLPTQADPVPAPSSPGYSQPPWNTLIEFDDAVVETGAIVRYQEAMTDLDTFKVIDTLGNTVVWPRMSPADPFYDFTGSDDNLYRAMLDTVKPGGLGWDSGTGPTIGLSDLRDQLADRAGFYSRIDASVIEDMFRARKREIWIAMLAASPPVEEYFWRDVPTVAPDDRPQAENYVMCEDIVSNVYSLSLPGFTLIDIPSPFAYKAKADPGDNDWYPSFNHLDNLTYTDLQTGFDRGYTQFANENYPGTYLDGEAFDAALIEAASASETELGTPIEPRLPSYVRVQFWVALRPKFTTNREFRRWFVEEFVVPSAISRGTVATLTRRERT